MGFKCGKVVGGDIKIPLMVVLLISVLNQVLIML